MFLLRCVQGVAALDALPDEQGRETEDLRERLQSAKMRFGSQGTTREPTQLDRSSQGKPAFEVSERSSEPLGSSR